jgi:hypothetical protein
MLNLICGDIKITLVLLLLQGFLHVFFTLSTFAWRHFHLPFVLVIGRQSLDSPPANRADYTWLFRSICRACSAILLPR